MPFRRFSYVCDLGNYLSWKWVQYSLRRDAVKRKASTRRSRVAGNTDYCVGEISNLIREQKICGEGTDRNRDKGSSVFFSMQTRSCCSVRRDDWYLGG